MKIDRIIAHADRPLFSFEFYPPKSDAGERVLGLALESLRQLDPDFVSVTYGAGGSTRARTLELTKWIKQELGIEAMAHLSCVGVTTDELRTILDDMSAAGIENVLALRGDPPRGETEWRAHPGGLSYSTELAALISAEYDACVGGACFPEVHPEAPDLAHDLRFLREKIDNGVSFLITQLFFDNELYFRFVDEARAAGIEVPILPGIMPITNLQPDQDDHRPLQGVDPRAAARGAGVALARPRGGAPAGGLVRDPAVRRAAGPWRPRNPLLHAEPLARHARDPVGAEAAAPVGHARRRQDRRARPRSGVTSDHASASPRPLRSRQ